MGNALITDLYELNMAASYLRRGMAGTGDVQPVRTPSSTESGLSRCRGPRGFPQLPPVLRLWPRRPVVARDSGFSPGRRRDVRRHALQWGCACSARGRVIFANEPVLEVTAPIAEAQLVETYLLNQITYQTALATKATRCRLAAGDIELVDFALRRTHGAEAGMAVARVSAIAGFEATSNVEAARRFGLKAAGTMAHSYIEAFSTEAGAFRAFAEDLPERTTFLVDTYDTRTGVEAAIGVIRQLGLNGPLGVRLDSGDLARLARETREQLDGAGLPDVRIFVSGGLDEYDLERFRVDKIPIDAAGVGTQMGVSADAPSLDSAYKLVAFGERPVLKLSTGKATLPGAKQVWRRLPIREELLATRNEPGPAGMEPLLVPVMRGGVREGPPDTVAAARQRLERDLDGLYPSACDLHAPTCPPVVLSERLQALRDQVTAGLSAHARGSDGHPPA